MVLQEPKSLRSLLRSGKPSDWLLHPTLPTIAAVLFTIIVGFAAVYVEAVTSWDAEAQGIDLLVRSAHARDPRAMRTENRSLELSRFVVVRSTLVANAPAQDADTCAARLAERLGNMLDARPGTPRGPNPLADVSAVIGVCGRGETSTHVATDIPRLVILRPHFDAGGHHVATEITIVETTPRPTIIDAVGRPSVLAAVLGIAVVAGFVTWHWSRAGHRRMVDLWAAASIDGLSGALRREAFVAWLSGAISEARASASPLAALVIDIDNLKALNDAAGHAAGDQAIRLVAGSIKGVLGPDSVVGRLGGDEFAVLMAGTTVKQATVAAEKIRVAVEAARLGAEDLGAETTVSIGVAELAAGDDAAALIQRADGALYDAKLTNRNRVIAAS